KLNLVTIINSNTGIGHDSLVVITGGHEVFFSSAVFNDNRGEEPPTLVEPPKMFRPVKALFDGLGIAPGYTEADVSVPFMCYFSLFFAMLVGDGA
ncbi:MAG: hypothetical protein IJ940_03745, partial [Bacteroidales bacterium]|nr:hypothetical protein [Bacteroidales bacterium]